ncbi:hypothetical protein JD844_014604 [Phrynosoma platyrhinos]|uniref:Peptidase M12B propeptide domain-containing protein n=1 Tax=Phrynosoma platyrhinos TaxID=52577 RepID=A0ABQ7SRZ5_PHRPL|nr:hypothetical protein JD844_014604 [Phrynosoma platyrhinos]
MFDGSFLWFLSPILLLLFCRTGVHTASEDVAVVIPEQVPHERIHFLQAKGSQTHGDRSRRSASLNLEEEEETEALIIHLPTGNGFDLGSSLYLNLRPNAQFLAPGFSVLEIAEDQSSHRVDVDQGCFYTGHVLNHSFDSFASLSTCNGLVGLIQIGSEQVQIQPVNASETLFDGKEHFIRRKRSTRSARPARLESPIEHCKVVADLRHPLGFCTDKGSHYDVQTEKKRQKKTKLTDDWRERRNAIQLTNEYTVETLVVADSDMVQYHGADAAQRFILTVMNMIVLFLMYPDDAEFITTTNTMITTIPIHPPSCYFSHPGIRVVVYNMFQHQSLGVKVSIRVTKLVLLRRRPVSCYKF